MAESFPAFLRSLERSIEPLESIAGVAPPFADEDDVEATTASDLAFVLRDLRRAAAGARALITSTNLPEDSDDEGTQILAPPEERTQLDDAAPTVPYASQPLNEETQTQREPPPIVDGVVVGAKVKKYFQREGTCRGTVKSLERVVIDWDDGTQVDYSRSEVSRMLVADRAIVPFEGDHPRGGRRKRSAARRTSASAELGRGRRPKSGPQRFAELVDGGKTYKAESPAKNPAPTKTCPACATRVHARKAKCDCGHVFLAKTEPSGTTARASAANSEMSPELPPLAEDVTSLIARDAPIKRTKKHRAPRYERYTTATSAQEYLRMGGARKDLKYDIDSGFIAVTDRGPRVEESSSDDEPEYPNKPRDPNGLASLPSVGEAASMVDMEPVQSRTLDAESKQRALWPFKPPNPGRRWENSCSSSTGQYQDTQYDEQPKRHDKRRYARLAPRESLSPVPERSSSPEAPNTPASSPRREDDDGGATGEVKRKAEWVGNSLDLTLEDSQDDSPPESKDETRLSEADATRLSNVSKPVDEEWDDTQAPERPPGYTVPPVRQSYTGSSPEEPEQRPTRRHLVAAPPRGDETDDGEDEDDDAPPSKRRRAADESDAEAPQRVVELCAAMGLAVSRGQAAKALTRGDVAHAVSMLVESETRGVAASRPRSRAGSPRPQ